MKPLNAQRTLYQAFSTGREAVPLLKEAKEYIDAIALSGQWQKRFAGFWSGGSQGSQRGPQGHDIVFMIRLVLAQCVLRKDYRELAALLEDSLGLRGLLEIEYVKDKALPKFQTIAAWVKALPAKFLEEVNGELVREQGGQKEGMALKQWRGDATCVESNIHYPTDSSWLRDGLNWLYRWIGRMRGELGVRARLDTEVMSYAKGHRIYLEIVKCGQKGRKKQRKKAYRRLIQPTQRVIGHFQGQVKKGRQLGAFDTLESPVQ